MNSIYSISQRSSVSDLTSFVSSDVLSEVSSEIIVKNRIQYGSIPEAAVGVFMEYCKNSTIHGIRYIGQRKRPLIERIFWILVFIMSIYACTYQIIKVWKKWDDTPVIVSFNEEKAPIWDIPFPSVIVCPETKARGDAFNFSKVYNYVRKTEKGLENITATDIAKLQAFIHLCDLEVSTKLNLEANDTIDIGATLLSIAETVNNTTPFCKFRSVEKMCEEWFTYVQTDDGICYQFNGLSNRDLLRDGGNDEFYEDELIPSTEWSLENGYAPDAGDEVHPMRVLVSGYPGGLVFTAQGNKFNLDYLCRGSSQGFRPYTEKIRTHEFTNLSKVYLQAPDDVPQAAKQFFRVSFGEEVVININPNFQTTSINLKAYKPEQRQCYFNHERYLRFFKVYTQKNCDFECLVNFTISKCGCAKYFMPKTIGVRTCGISDIECYNQAEYEILEREFQVAIESSKGGKFWKTECNCLPACTSLAYDFEISQAHYDVWKLLGAHKTDYTDTFPGLLMSRVSLFFSEQYFITIKRSALYDTTDFIANCGGLFGLFMGVSFLSLIELIYFCSVRLTSNLKMRWSRQKNDLLP